MKRIIPWLIYALIGSTIIAIYLLTLPPPLPSPRGYNYTYGMVKDYIIFSLTHAKKSLVYGFVLLSFAFYTIRGQIRFGYGLIELIVAVLLVDGAISDLSKVLVPEGTLKRFAGDAN